MSQSYTRSEATTVTRADVLHVNWKIRCDLDQLRREYGGWTADYIKQISEDIFQWLYRGYADKVEIFFYYANGSVAYAVSYSLDRNNQISIDNDAGRIRPKNLSGTTSLIKVTTNSTWSSLSDDDKTSFYTSLNKSWNGAIPTLSFDASDWKQDKTYASNAFGATRSVYQA